MYPRRTTFYTLQMYTNYLLPVNVPVTSSFAKLEHSGKQTDVLDVVLTSDKEGKNFVLAVVNKDPKHEPALVIDFASLGKKATRQLTGRTLCGRSADDYNDRGDEHVYNIIYWNLRGFHNRQLICYKSHVFYRL